MEKKYFTTSETALLLNISRQAVFKKIKAGKIKARRRGRYLLIGKNDLAETIGDILSQEMKKQIKKAAKRVIDKYEETLGALGDSE